MFSWLRRMSFRRSPADVRVMFAPSHDGATQKTSSWAMEWELEGVRRFVCENAQSELALAFARRGPACWKVICFVGHGIEGGLCTAPALGKRRPQVEFEPHGCLLEVDDLDSNVERLQVVAWACQAGRVFGRHHENLKLSGFLGFDDYVDLAYGVEESERLWSSLMKATFSRALDKGLVSRDDRDWLRGQLLATRARIKDGTLDTGDHNRWNRMFLKSAAKAVCAFVAED